jgi:restriction system protein
MTYLDAAYEILKQVGRPLRNEEITKGALARHCISPHGLTPEATMASRLYTDTLHEGSLFVRPDKGFFDLTRWQPEGIETQVERSYRAGRNPLSRLG